MEAQGGSRNHGQGCIAKVMVRVYYLTADNVAMSMAARQSGLDVIDDIVARIRREDDRAPHVSEIVPFT